MSGYHDNAIFWVELAKIQPNPFQPRKEFEAHALEDLADSIRQYGVLQPLVVTRKESTRSDGGLDVSYELIAGERRLRAAKIAGLQQLPVIIRKETDDKVKLELAIIENLQREDLNPIERAIAFERLHREFELTHAEIGKKMGKSRVYVSNSLRLLSLPEYIKKALVEGKISEGHTRPLLMLVDRPEEQETLFKEIMVKNMSVRDAEKIARKVAQDKIRKKEFEVDPEIRRYEKRMSEKLGTRVSIEPKENGGKIVIDYFSTDDLETIFSSLQRQDPQNAQRMMDSFIEQQGGKEYWSPSQKIDDTKSENSAQTNEAQNDLQSSTSLRFEEKVIESNNTHKTMTKKEGTTDNSALDAKNSTNDTPQNTSKNDLLEATYKILEEQREQLTPSDTVVENGNDKDEPLSNNAEVQNNGQVSNSGKPASSQATLSSQSQNQVSQKPSKELDFQNFEASKEVVDSTADQTLNEFKGGRPQQEGEIMHPETNTQGKLQNQKSSQQQQRIQKKSDLQKDFDLAFKDFEEQTATAQVEEQVPHMQTGTIDTQTPHANGGPQNASGHDPYQESLHPVADNSQPQNTAEIAQSVSSQIAAFETIASQGDNADAKKQTSASALQRQNSSVQNNSGQNLNGYAPNNQRSSNAISNQRQQTPATPSQSASDPRGGQQMQGNGYQPYQAPAQGSASQQVQNQKPEKKGFFKRIFG